MKTYYVDENNSGGYCVALKRFGEHAIIKAANAEEAIKKFESHFDLNWEHQNSYEGNSCNCCGRRFSLYTPDQSEEDMGIKQIWHYSETPYFVDGIDDIGGTANEKGEPYKFVKIQ